MLTHWRGHAGHMVQGNWWNCTGGGGGDWWGTSWPVVFWGNSWLGTSWLVVFWQLGSWSSSACLTDPFPQWAVADCVGEKMEHEVCIGMETPGPVPNREAEREQGKIPPENSGVIVLHAS